MKTTNQLSRRKINNSWLIFLIVFTATIMLVWHIWQQEQETETQQTLMADITFSDASKEIFTYLTDLHRGLKLFANGNRANLQYITRQPDDQAALEKFTVMVKEFFPNAFAVTIANQTGTPLIDNLDGLVSDVCIKDIGKYAATQDQSNIYIHPNQEGYHFDIMVKAPLEGADPVIFFVSFHPHKIANLLYTHLVPGMKTFLIKKDSNGLIEITPDGSRLNLKRDFFLTEEEKTSIKFRVPIDGSQWEIIAYPDPDNIINPKAIAVRDTIWSVTVLLSVGFIAALLLGRSDRRIATQQKILSTQAQELNESHELLTAISNTQQAYITSTDPKKLFDQLLEDILKITDSEYGFIGEVLKKEDGSPYLKTQAITNIAWNEDTRKFYEENAPQGLEFFNLKTLFGNVLTSKKSVIANQPESDSRSGGLPEGHPDLNAFLGVPLFHGGNMVGMVGLSNRPGSYNEQLIQSMEPLLNTCGNIINAYSIEKKRADAVNALRGNEIYIRTILDTVVDGIVTLNEQGMIQTINPAMESIFGYQHDELKDQSFMQLMTEPWRTEYASYLAEYLKTGKAQILGQLRETTGLRKNGDTFSLELSVGEMLIDDKRLLTCIVRDISERKKSESELNEARQELEHVISLTPAVLYTAKAYGDYGATYISPNIKAQIGYEPKDFTDDPGFWATNIHPDDRERVLADLEQLVKHNHQIHEYRFKAKNGDYHWMRDEIQLIRDKENNPVETAGYWIDITNQKLAELEKESSENRIKAIVDTVVDGIITININGIIQTFNPAAEQIFGYQANEVVGKNIKTLMPEPYQSEHDTYLDNYQNSGEAKIIGIGREVKGRRKDGSTFPLDLAVSEMTIGDERMYTGIVRDITERKKIDKMKNEFISTVSHELRTPLTSIRGSLGLLRGGTAGKLPEKANSLLEIASNNSERLLLLINDILDIEKIESGELSLKFKTTSLMDLLDLAVIENKGYADAHGIHFEVTDRLDGAMLYADHDRLMQVMNNLLSNAAKFSPKGSTVRITPSLHENLLRVSIKDEGQGIPEEFQDRIFQKFAQADSSDTRMVGGTGLGLSITKALVEKHGGTIDFETTPGKGTTFFIDLPEQQEGQIQVTQNKHAKARILICEDDRDTAKLLQLMLAKENYDTDTSYTTADAKLKLATNTYIAMTLDIMLQNQDSISLLQELRKDPKTKEMPIIMISAIADQSKERVDCSTINIANWLNKPIDHERLLSALQNINSDNGQRNLRLLHIEDDPDILQVVKTLLIKQASVIPATSLQDARDLLEQDNYDAILLDVGLPDGSGLDILDTLNDKHPGTPVILFTAQEANDDVLERVNAALVKSRTSNEKLVDTILSCINQ